MNAPSLFSYLSPEEGAAICKLADGEKKKKNRALEAAKAVVIPALGFGAGTALGLGGGLLADTITKKVTGKPVSREFKNQLSPALGALGGLTWGLYQRHTLEDLTRALQGDPDPTPPRG